VARAERLLSTPASSLSPRPIPPSPFLPWLPSYCRTGPLSGGDDRGFFLPWEPIFLLFFFRMTERRVVDHDVLPFSFCGAR